MLRKLYQEIASTLVARRNCAESGNDEWFDRHTEKLEEYANMLPSGSGFDSGTKIDLDASTPNRLVLHTSYHHMDEMGGYDGWTDHDVIITPDLVSGYSMRITGRDRNDIKEYIAQTFSEALDQDILLQPINQN